MKAKHREFWRGSLLLLCGNGAGGVLNYGFQVQAARRLNLDEYGTLNSWIANMTIIMSAGVLCHMLSMYFPLSRRRLVWSGGALFSTAVATVACLAFLELRGALTEQINLIAVFFIGLPGSWLGGQLLARMRFGALGLAGLIGASAKLCLAFTDLPGRPILDSFYLAITVSGAIAAGMLGLAAMRTPMVDDQGTTVHHMPAARITSAVILAFSGAIVPQLDLINLRANQVASVIGQYSRVTLFAKAIFFGAATALQVTLPIHLNNQHKDAARTRLNVARRVDIGLLIGCSMGACIAAWLGPWLSRRFLDFDLSDYRMWILLTGLIASVLFGLLQEIQRDCAALKWRRAAVCLATLLGLIVVNLVVGPVSVGIYLGMALCYYGLLLALFLWTSGDFFQKNVKSGNGTTQVPR